jgi:hypothetical protein
MAAYSMFGQMWMTFLVYLADFFWAKFVRKSFSCNLLEQAWLAK